MCPHSLHTQSHYIPGIDQSVLIEGAIYMCIPILVSTQRCSYDRFHRILTYNNSEHFFVFVNTCTQIYPWHYMLTVKAQASYPKLTQKQLRFSPPTPACSIIVIVIYQFLRICQQVFQCNLKKPESS